MKIILEIIRLVKREGLESSKMFNLNKPENLVDRFVVLALEEKATTDEKMSQLIYNKSSSAAKYKNLKKRVKKKLFESIPFIAEEHLGVTSDYNKAKHICEIQRHKILMLSKVAAYNSLIYLIKEHYQLAEKFQLYSYLKDFSYQLVRTYAILGKTKELENESKNLNKYIFEEQFLFKVYNHYFRIVSKLQFNSSVSESDILSIKNTLLELEKESTISESYESKYWISHIRITYLTVIKDYDSLRNALISLDELLNNWKYFPSSRTIANSIQNISLLFKLRDYENGFALALENDKLFITKQSNWSLFMTYKFYNAINMEPSKASSVYSEIMESKLHKLNNNESFKQLWIINHAFLQAALYHSKSPANRSINVYKFINEVDIYAKDKCGYNFSIFVAELMHYLIKDDLDCYINRVTALTNYRTRHLRHPDFRRSYVFAGLLLQVYKKGFDPYVLRLKCEDEYNYLCTDQDRLQINEWEIVDYDKLWLIILEVLEKRLAK